MNIEEGSPESERQSLHLEAATFANACKAAAAWAALHDWPLFTTSTTSLKLLGYGRACQGPAVAILYPRRSLVRNALARHFAKANRASLGSALKLPEYTPVWDQQWQVVDTLSASQKQRARSAEGQGSSIAAAAKSSVAQHNPQGSSLVPVRSAPLRTYAKEEPDSDDDILLANLVYTDRLIA